MLEMQGISKVFGHVQALNGASIEVKAGEVMALLGANGSGKSTLMKILGGLVHADAGEIRLNGKPITIHSASDVHRHKIAIGLQDSSLIPTLSIRSNILLGIESRKGMFLDRKRGNLQTKEILERLGVSFSPDLLVSELAPSDQAMIEIAKALARDPDLLVLDEVTASLHAKEVEQVFCELERLKNAGKAIVIVTHRMSEVFQISDRCTILRGGETVTSGETKSFTLEEIVYHMTGKHPVARESLVRSEIDTEGKSPLIQTCSLSSEPVLKSIDFSAFKGEIVGIGGLNGQGQSEFIRCLLGDRQPTAGEIIYENRSTHFRGPVDAVQKGIGFISGDRNTESIFPLRSVAENIYAAKATVGPLFGALSPDKVRSFSQKVIDAFGIVAGSPDHSASSLSGGNQQKLIIGRWLGMSPKLLLLDDPTKGVDIHSRREIHKILRQATEKGMCVIYVSSDNDELLEIADRIYVFFEGQVSAVLNGGNCNAENLVTAMLAVNDQRKENS